jgi:16S rRNA (guanine966-N2)-methyltransferase
MRERGFAVLGEQIVGARFLDLYAGTGAVGLEALSRGASKAVFVERNRQAASLIRKNLDAFDLDTDQAELIVRPAAVAVNGLIRRGAAFDIAWADPPFEAWREGLEGTHALFEGGVLGSGSLACLECPSKADVAGSLQTGLEIFRDLAGSASRVVMIEYRPG